MDKFPLGKSSSKAQDTLHWLERHGMSHEKLEQYVANDAVVGKLRNRIAADGVETLLPAASWRLDTAARIARSR